MQLFALARFRRFLLTVSTVKHTPGGLGVLATAVLVALGVVIPAISASAETSPGWADWDPLTGSAGDWSTTVRLPAGGFPAATVTSDSRGGVGVVSGASSWLGPATPPGEVFGSSRDQQYLNLRPQADRPTTPSTTTYTFERPTPEGGWALVLGDIDADRAVVTARGADGRLLAGAELGWQRGFNYCSGAGSPSCAGAPEDVPTWDPATGELLGNTGAADTSGAAGWFRPTAPITSLTVELYQRSGFPVYQTWLASLARDIAGTVNLVDTAGAPRGVLPGATLTLFGPDGAELDTATSDESGQYIFPGYVAAPGYRVELTTLPEAGDAYRFGLLPSGERAVDEIDLSAADATGVDLAAREIRPVAVSGRVLADDGAPVPGATVTLTPVGGGAPRTAVTSSTGGYLIDDVGWDTADDEPQDYTFALSDLPDGYATAEVPDGITVAVDQEEPSAGNNFVVRAPASVSGTVTVGGEPVAGVVVTLTGPDGRVGTTTAADGTYVFDGVLPGDHTVRVTPPDGYRAVGPDTRDVTVEAENLADVDFTLSRPGSIGGAVTDDVGDPVPDATVTVAGPGGSITLATDAAGGYFTGDLAPGDYVITLTVPDGYTGDVTERAVAVTRAGENWLEEHFAVVGVPVPSATPTSSASPSVSAAPGRTPEPSAGPAPGSGADGGGEPGSGSLAATGATVGAIGLAAAILVAMGVALVRASRTSSGGSGRGRGLLRAAARPRRRDVLLHRGGRTVGVTLQQRGDDPPVTGVRVLDVRTRRLPAVLRRVQRLALDVRHDRAAERVLRGAVDQLVQLDVDGRVGGRVVDQPTELVELGGQRGPVSGVEPGRGPCRHRALQGRAHLDEVVEVDEAVLALEERVQDHGVQEVPLLLVEHHRAPALPGGDQALLGERRRGLADDGAADLVLLAQDTGGRQRRPGRVLADDYRVDQALDDSRGERGPVPLWPGHGTGRRCRVHVVGDSIVGDPGGAPPGKSEGSRGL